MKKKYIYLVGGKPGSGKSTYIHQHKQENDAVFYLEVFGTDKLEEKMRDGASRIFVEAEFYSLERRHKIQQLVYKYNYSPITVMCEHL